MVILKDLRNQFGTYIITSKINQNSNFFIVFYFINDFLCNEFNHLNFINMSEVRAKVVSIIVDKLGVEESEVTFEASFTNDLGADSLDTVELIMEFEKEFNLSVFLMKKQKKLKLLVTL